VGTLIAPLHPETETMINAKSIKKFKRGCYLTYSAGGNCASQTK